MIIENEYRSHYCGKLDIKNVGEEVKLSGWMHSIRDHGGLVFIDLRDQFGFTQIVIDQKSAIFKKIFLVKGISKAKPTKSVKKPGIIKSKAANAIEAPEISS